MKKQVCKVAALAAFLMFPVSAWAQNPIHDAGAKIRFEYGINAGNRYNNGYYNNGYRAQAVQRAAPIQTQGRSFSYDPAQAGAGGSGCDQPMTSDSAASDAKQDTSNQQAAAPNNARRFSYQPQQQATQRAAQPAARRVYYNYNAQPRLHRWEDGASKAQGRFND